MRTEPTHLCKKFLVKKLYNSCSELSDWLLMFDQPECRKMNEDKFTRAIFGPMCGWEVSLYGVDWFGLDQTSKADANSS